jgi:hypothetical protein
MNYNEYLNTLSNFGVVNELQQQATQALTEKKDTDLTDLAFSSGGVGKFAERVKGYYDKGMEIKAKAEDAYKAYQEKGIEGVAEKIQPKLGELVGKGKKLVKTVEEGGLEKGVEKIKEFAGSKLDEAKDLVKGAVKDAYKSVDEIKQSVGALSGESQDKLKALQNEFSETKRKFTEANNAGDTELAEKLRDKGAELRNKVGELMGRDKKDVEGALNRNIYGKELDAFSEKALQKGEGFGRQAVSKIIEEPRKVISRGIKRTPDELRAYMEDFDPEEGINMISGMPKFAQSSIQRIVQSIEEGIAPAKEVVSSVAEGIDKAPEAAASAVEELQRVPETLTAVGKGMVQPVEDVLQGVKSSAEQGVAAAKNVVESSTSKLMSAGEDLAKGGTEFAEKTASEALGAVSEIPIIGEIADVALAGYSLYDLIKSRPSMPSTITTMGAEYQAGQI